MIWKICKKILQSSIPYKPNRNDPQQKSIKEKNKTPETSHKMKCLILQALYGLWEGNDHDAVMCVGCLSRVFLS